MKTDAEAIEEAINEVIGTPPPIGSVCAHRDDPINRELVSIEDGIATLSYGGVTRTFPASEVFDPNDVKRATLRILARQAASQIVAAPTN